MSLSSTTVKVSYAGDDSTVSFPVTFVFWDDTDIKAILRNAAGAETVWVLGTQYTLSGGNGATGTLTVDTSPTDYTPATGETLVIKSARANTQPTAFPLGGAFPSTSAERAIDQAVRLIQQRSEEIDRAIVLSETSSGVDTELPSPQAGYVLGWNTAGNGLRNYQSPTADADSVIYTPAGTGAVPTTVQSKLRESVSVKDYGAVGDGVTDDTAAIQAAFTSSAANIYFGDATNNYKVSAKLTSTVAGRVIFGHGAKITPTSAIAAAYYALVVSGANSRVEGLNFVGTAASAVDCGALFLGASGIAVQNNVFSDFDNGGGVVGNSAATNAVVTHNRLTNCNPVELGGLQYGSIHINGDNSTISENTIIDCDLTGISTSGADTLRILGNHMIGKSGSTTSGGVIMDGAGVGCVIANNTIKRMAVEGIQIANNDGVTSAPTTDHIISGNIIDDCDVSGITLAGTTATSLARITIQGNHITSALTTARGIELVRGLKVNITGNYVYGYGTGLSVVQASPDLNVVGNTFENQTTTAISAAARYMNIIGNKIIGILASTTGITFNGSTTAGEQLITGNQIRNCLVGITGTFSGTQRTYIYNNFFIGNTTDMSLTSQTTNSTFHNVFDKALSGEFTLVAGSATVSNAQLLATDKIEIWKKTAGGTAGAVYVNAITPGTSFTVASTNGADTSTYYYALTR